MGDYPKLAELKACIGCTACYNICPTKKIKLSFDYRGFIRPVIDDSINCIECGQCERVCPVLHPIDNTAQSTKCYAVKSKNDNIRDCSSSGGVFSEIAIKVLNSGGIVYGAAYSDDFSVQHIGIESVEELTKLRGAKYAQSDLSDTYCKIENGLKQGRIVLFSGTPCQVAGLKSFLKKEFENLITIDFVCHGVPSPQVWENYVFYRAKKDNNGILPLKINMRSKESGWSNYSYSMRFDFQNHSYVAQNGNDIFMALFVQNYILRDSCYNCRFKGINKVSDVTLGDFWGIWELSPVFDDNKGVSLVIPNTEKGNSILKELDCHKKAFDVEYAVKYNPSIIESATHNNDRDKIFSLALNSDFKKVEKIVLCNSNPIVKFKSYIKNVIKKIKGK
ncbi:MAG: Coenzyme F420 hydrogenase/dehydrogenase, beta subunit C-terminal domain [Clostridia bacterium]|nr:Coenzyme F420 hydrogenase/dehydrogenase, beta subunit C-terminal domain [Clostridia bacterium]